MEDAILKAQHELYREWERENIIDYDPAEAVDI